MGPYPSSISAWDATFFNSLPHVDVRVNELPDDASLCAFPTEVEALGGVIRKHGMEGEFGISLLHKHYDMSPNNDEVVAMAKGKISTDKSIVFTSSVEKASDQVPYSWALASNGAWKPVAFASRKDFLVAGKQCYPTAPNDFMAEFAEKLKALRMDGNFALTWRLVNKALPDQWDRPGWSVVERTQEVLREQRFYFEAWVPGGGTARSLQTFWEFQDEGPTDNCLPQYRCEYRDGRHRSVNYSHICEGDRWNHRNLG